MQSLAIIVGCYKQEQYVQQALWSARNQVVPPQVAKTSNKLPKITVIESHDNCDTQGTGSGAHRNRAIEKVDADWILWLDADDLLPSHFVSRMFDHVNPMQKHLIVSPRSQFISGARLDEFVPFRMRDKQFIKEKIVKMTKEVRNEVDRFRDILWPLYPLVISSVFHKSMWEKVGGFDPKMSFANDLDFWFRCRKAGASFVCAQDTFLFRRNIKKFPLGNTEEENARNQERAQAAFQLFYERHGVLFKDLYLPYYVPETDVI